MVRLIQSAVLGQRQDPLFRNDVVQFHFADFKVKPARFQQVVKPYPRRFEMEGSRVVCGRNKKEGNVLVQRARRQDIHAGEVESLCRNSQHSSYGLIDRKGTVALTMPIRSDAKRYRPVRRLLKYRGITVIAQLIAVIFEHLAEVVQLGPGFVTGRARKPILAGKCGDSARLLNTSADQESEGQN